MKKYKCLETALFVNKYGKKTMTDPKPKASKKDIAAAPERVWFKRTGLTGWPKEWCWEYGTQPGRDCAAEGLVPYVPEAALDEAREVADWAWHALDNLANTEGLNLGEQMIFEKLDAFLAKHGRGDG